jgi:hypothetical protein
MTHGNDIAALRGLLDEIDNKLEALPSKAELAELSAKLDAVLVGLVEPPARAQLAHERTRSR